MNSWSSHTAYIWQVTDMALYAVCSKDSWLWWGPKVQVKHKWHMSIELQAACVVNCLSLVKSEYPPLVDAIWPTLQVVQTLWICCSGHYSFLDGSGHKCCPPNASYPSISLSSLYLDYEKWLHLWKILYMPPPPPPPHLMVITVAMRLTIIRLRGRLHWVHMAPLAGTKTCVRRHAANTYTINSSSVPKSHIWSLLD